MKKYKISHWDTEIEEVEVERETDKYVFLRNSYRNKVFREAKESGYVKYFDTLDEARSHLIQRTEEQIKGLERGLDIAKDRLKILKQA